MFETSNREYCILALKMEQISVPPSVSSLSSISSSSPPPSSLFSPTLIEDYLSHLDEQIERGEEEGEIIEFPEDDDSIEEIEGEEREEEQSPLTPSPPRLSQSHC